MTTAPTMIRVKLVRSPIGRPEKHRRILLALGLRRLHQVHELPDAPTVRGMINKVPHMVVVLD